VFNFPLPLAALYAAVIFHPFLVSKSGNIDVNARVDKFSLLSIPASPGLVISNVSANLEYRPGPSATRARISSANGCNLSRRVVDSTSAVLTIGTVSTRFVANSLSSTSLTTAACGKSLTTWTMLLQVLSSALRFFNPSQAQCAERPQFFQL